MLHSVSPPQNVLHSAVREEKDREAGDSAQYGQFLAPPSRSPQAGDGASMRGGQGALEMGLAMPVERPDPFPGDLFSRHPYLPVSVWQYHSRKIAVQAKPKAPQNQS